MAVILIGLYIFKFFQKLKFKLFPLNKKLLYLKNYYN